jgi:hypothetical protein
MDRKYIAMLIEAGALIKRVTQELDESGKRCHSCGLDIKNNWPEAKAAKWLHQLPSKLRDVYKRLDTDVYLK